MAKALPASPVSGFCRGDVQLTAEAALSLSAWVDHILHEGIQIDFLHPGIKRHRGTTTLFEFQANPSLEFSFVKIRFQFSNVKVFPLPVDDACDVRDVEFPVRKRASFDFELQMSFQRSPKGNGSLHGYLGCFGKTVGCQGTGGLWANRPGDRHGVDTANRMGQGHEPFLSIDEQALGARFPFSANQLGIFQMQETVGVASLSGEGKPVLTAIAPPACLNDGVSSSAFTIPPAPPNFPFDGNRILKDQLIEYLLCFCMQHGTEDFGLRHTLHDPMIILGSGITLILEMGRAFRPVDHQVGKGPLHGFKANIRRGTFHGDVSKGGLANLKLGLKCHGGFDLTSPIRVGVGPHG